ncbi:MAG: DUF6653 family protein [Candidatus Nanohaloarchaea archaeon]|nr:DUF6653 family protein [Candidatus Nanohaloarchaea archaeon]
MARVFSFDEETWLRHANPLSVYTRYTVLPLLIVSLWSRRWIGTYFLIPLALSMVWMYVNPRLFGKPDSFDSWAARSVLGERIWKEKSSYDVGKDFIIQIRILNLIQVLAIPPLAWGLYYFEFWPTLTGFILLNLGKSWFLDRMVWLYQEHSGEERVKQWTG